MKVKQLSSVEKQSNLSCSPHRSYFLFIGIVGKLFWIQIATTESYSSHGINLVKNSVVQRQRALVLGKRAWGNLRS